MPPNGLVARLDGFVQRKAGTLAFKRPFPIRAAKPIISFTFDDFPASALTTGGTILRRFNASGTYYASFGLCGTIAPTGEIFVPGDLALLLEQGHELACHTYAHCHSWQTDSKTFERSILQNRQTLQQLIPGADFKSFSYPISPPRPATKAKAGHHFLSCRGGGQTFNTGIADLNYLAAYFLEKTRNQFQPVKEAIDATVAARGWMIFATHDVADGHSPYGCTPEFFEQVVAYATRSGACIQTVYAALQSLGRPVPRHKGPRFETLIGSTFEKGGIQMTNLNPLEQILVRLDRDPWGALYRFAVGMLTFNAWDRWGTRAATWLLLPFLAVALLLLRVAPAICRAVLPFSNRAREIWLYQRNIGRFYDSYQWQKLFWIGLGMAVQLGLAWRLNTSGVQHPLKIWLAAGCLLSGASGMIIYRGIIRKRSTAETIGLVPDGTSRA